MNALIFGGGKIARGFVAQLLYRSGFHTVFAVPHAEKARALNDKGSYYVNVMGNPAESQWISNYECICTADVEAVARAIETADIGFTAVGGKNLGTLALTIAQAYALAAPRMGDRRFTIITCENWVDPGKQLRAAVLSALAEEELKRSFDEHIGISEAAILRSGVEATEEVLSIDENAVSVTDYWELPVDAGRIKGEQICFEGVFYRDDFDSFLKRKLYTFNTTNATIAYLGCLRGIRLLADAANDADIVESVRKVHTEINPAIREEMGGALEEQYDFSQKAMRKYQDRSVTDFTERHARDPIRKLGPSDRIVGTLRLVEKYGMSYDELAMVLAAAIYYPVTNPEDASAVRLRELREEIGPLGVMETVCEIGRDEKAAQTVLAKIEYLKKKGWLHE